MIIYFFTFMYKRKDIMGDYFRVFLSLFLPLKGLHLTSMEMMKEYFEFQWLACKSLHYIYICIYIYIYSHHRRKKLQTMKSFVLLYETSSTRWPLSTTARISEFKHLSFMWKRNTLLLSSFNKKDKLSHWKIKFHIFEPSYSILAWVIPCKSP